jgi:3-phenylpropionate/trans-cinnamate dioxygenase ferredoxin subunit
MAWQRVASIADVQADAPLAVTVGERQLAIYRIGDNFYALDDICPHAFALLSSGFIEGDKVECPLHQALFHIPTGKCLGPPATSDLTVFPVKVEGSDIEIDV